MSTLWYFKTTDLSESCMEGKKLIFCKAFNIKTLNLVKFFGTPFDIINGEDELK
ncbi:hypothetical protein [Caldithrix abyssi]